MRYRVLCSYSSLQPFLCGWHEVLYFMLLEFISAISLWLEWGIVVDALRVHCSHFFMAGMRYGGWCSYNSICSCFFEAGMRYCVLCSYSSLQPFHCGWHEVLCFKLLQFIAAISLWLAWVMMVMLLQFIAAVSLWLVWGMVVDAFTVHCSSFFVAGMRYGGWCSYSSLQPFLCGWHELWWLMLLQFIAAVSLWLVWGIVFYALTVHCSHFFEAGMNYGGYALTVHCSCFFVVGMRYGGWCSYSSLQQFFCGWYEVWWLMLLQFIAAFLCGWYEVWWLMLLQFIAAVSLWLVWGMVVDALTVHCSHFFVAGMSYGGWCSYSSLQQFLFGWYEVLCFMLLQFIAAISLWLAWVMVFDALTVHCSHFFMAGMGYGRLMLLQFSLQLFLCGWHEVLCFMLLHLIAAISLWLAWVMVVMLLQFIAAVSLWWVWGMVVDALTVHCSSFSVAGMRYGGWCSYSSLQHFFVAGMRYGGWCSYSSLQQFLCGWYEVWWLMLLQFIAAISLWLAWVMVVDALTVHCSSFFLAEMRYCVLCSCSSLQPFLCGWHELWCLMLLQFIAVISLWLAWDMVGWCSYNSVCGCFFVAGMRYCVLCSYSWLQPFLCGWHELWWLCSYSSLQLFLCGWCEVWWLMLLQFIAAVCLWLVWGMVVDALTVHCSSFFVAGMRYGCWFSYSSLQQFLCGWYEVWWLMLLQFIAAVSLWLVWGLMVDALTVHCSSFFVAGMRYCVLCSYSSLQPFHCGWHEVLCFKLLQFIAAISLWLAWVMMVMLLQFIAAVSLWLVWGMVVDAFTVHCSSFFVAGMRYGGWCSYSSLQPFLCGWHELWWLMLLQFIAAVSLWLVWGIVFYALTVHCSHFFEAGMNYGGYALTVHCSCFFVVGMRYGGWCSYSSLQQFFCGWYEVWWLMLLQFIAAFLCGWYEVWWLMLLQFIAAVSLWLVWGMVVDALTVHCSHFFVAGMSYGGWCSYSSLQQFLFGWYEVLCFMLLQFIAAISLWLAWVMVFDALTVHCSHFIVAGMRYCVLSSYSSLQPFLCGWHELWWLCSYSSLQQFLCGWYEVWWLMLLQFIAAVSLWLVWGMVVDALTVHCSHFFVAGMSYGGWCSYSSLQLFLCGWYEVLCFMLLQFIVAISLRLAWIMVVMLLQFIAAVSLWWVWGMVVDALTVHCSSFSVAGMRYGGWCSYSSLQHFFVAGMRYGGWCSYSSLQQFLCGWYEVWWLMLLQFIAAISLWLAWVMVVDALTVHCSSFFLADMRYCVLCSCSSLQPFLCGWHELWCLMLLQFIAVISLWLAWDMVGWCSYNSVCSCFFVAGMRYCVLCSYSWLQPFLCGWHELWWLCSYSSLQLFLCGGYEVWWLMLLQFIAAVFLWLVWGMVVDALTVHCSISLWLVWGMVVDALTVHCSSFFVAGMRYGGWCSYSSLQPFLCGWHELWWLMLLQFIAAVSFWLIWGIVFYALAVHCSHFFVAGMSYGVWCSYSSLQSFLYGWHGIW